MQLNYGKTEVENLLSFINTAKSINLTTADVDVGTPEVIPGTYAGFDTSTPNQTIKRNTKVEITAKSSSTMYRGSYTYSYRRIDLRHQWDVLHNGRNVRYPENYFSTFDEANIKSFVKERLKFIESSVTITVEDLDDSEGTATVKISPIADSLIYVPDNTVGGEDDPLTLTLAKKKKELSSLVTNGDLDGFLYDTTITLPNPMVNGFEYSGG